MKRRALAMALLTTVLWSGSYIVNKIAFREGIGPLTLSGLRYLAAALLLLLLEAGRKKAVRRTLPFWMIALLGVIGYASAQGLQYVGQAYLTPTQSSLFLSVGNTLCVMLADRLWLRENQTVGDLLKMLVLIAGITLYYAPGSGGGVPLVGGAFMLLSSIGYAAQMTLNRRLLTTGPMDARTLVALPMLVGAGLLLTAGLAVEGWPRMTWTLAACLAYLSVASGALGFTLWTHSQKALTAFESSGINNLMLIEIALLDWLFFGRTFSAVQGIAIITVFGAVLAIQARPSGGKRA